MASETHARTLTATVVGGNFSGIAATIALRNAGIEATAFEQAPSVERLQGAKGGIHLWPNALRALDILGVGERVRERGTEFDRSDMVSTRGKLLTSFKLDEFRERIGIPTLHILRSELHRAIHDGLEAVAPGSLRTGARCAGFAQDEEGVTTRFEDGTEIRSDMLVGADGMKSAIRTQLFGPLELRPSGGPTIRGDASMTDIPFATRTTRIYTGRGTQFGLNRIDETHVTWFLRVSDESEIPIDLSAVSTIVRGWADPVERVVAATDPETMSRAETYDAPPIPAWGVGRVTLAGDAAHPMLNSLSQGAAQGFEDAAVLQLVLGELGTDDLPAALHAYEQRRMKRAADYVKRSRFMGDMAMWHNPVACGVRTAIMRVAGPAVWKKTQESASAAF
jgi:2-polyprenyl-6-methoxyphenol hydroxylase-like FAD-dependent oxidoreductase